MGLVPKSRAMVGSAVEMTVESRFSMNSAQATIRGTRMRSGMDGNRGGRNAPYTRPMGARAKTSAAILRIAIFVLLTAVNSYRALANADLQTGSAAPSFYFRG